MALSGELKDFGVLQLLTLVQVTAKSGALALQRGSESATVYFDNGKLTKVKNNNSRVGGLATTLYRAGKIDRDQYEAITLQTPSEKALGLLLEDQGIMTRDELAGFVAEKSVADLFWLLTWVEGSFRMDVDASPPEDDIMSPIELAPILDKGHTYLDEWQLLSTSIPDLDGPLKLKMEPQQSMEEITLSSDEWKLIATLAGDVPLRDVAEKMGLDDFAVRQIAYGLIGTGLAELGEAPMMSMPRFQQPESFDLDQSRSGGFGRLFGQRKK